MPLITSDTLARWFLEAEEEITQQVDFLYDRYEIPTVSGTAAYVLPDDCKSIRRITWLGSELSPLPRRQQNDIFQSANMLGKPFWYVYDNVGQQTIRLFPVPNQTLATGTDPWFADIPNCCIVEYSKIATGTAPWIIPPFLRPQLLKKYVGQRMYQIEGPSQSLVTAQYYAKSWDQAKTDFRLWIQEMIGKPRKLVINDSSGLPNLPASPILPINRYGIPVETGE